MIRPVQHAKVFPFTVLLAFGLQAAFGAQALDARHHALGLVLFAVAIDDPHRLAFAEFAEQRLGKQLGVRADDVVGGAQDGAGRAVVLLQLDDFERRKVLRQFFQVVQRRAAPAVDRLVVVAHRRKAAARADQQFQHFILRGVGVLVFIDQHMAERRLPLAAHFLVLLQQFQRQADQVVEIDALVGGQPLFVIGHDARHPPFLVAAGLRFGLRGVQSGAFPGADGPLPLARRGHVGAAAGVFQNAGHVVAVKDGKLRLQAQRLPVLPQHAHAQRMKGADQHALGRLANQAFGALAHFGSGLVGEGDGGDLLGPHAGLDQPANLVRDDPRFARTGTGQHEARAC